MDLIIGSHVSFSKNEQLLGSVKETISYGANTFMFYTGAPQNTNRLPIDDNLTNQGLELASENNIDYSKVIVHAPYIINLASDDSEKHNFAIKFLKEEIKRCEKLKIKNLVLHPGSHVKAGVDIGIENIINGLNEVFEYDSDVVVLIETMAGKGSECGKNIDEVKRIIDGVNNKNRIGICLDTCHLNDAGYDVSNFDDILDEFDRKIGIEKIKCIHINDSKNIIGSHKDRHENIGLGTIGFDTLINIIYNKRLEDIPKILETPYVTRNDDEKERAYPPYKFEIDMIKIKKINNNLIEDIRNYYK